MNGNISQRKRFSGDKFFLGCFVARPVLLKMDGVHRSIGPVVDVDRFLVFRGKAGSQSIADSGRTAWSNVDRCR